MRPLFAALAASLLTSCSSLPRPGQAAGQPASVEAAALLRASARQHGDPWQKLRRVEVGYDGEWTAIATRLQPVLTDPDFRKSSRETYEPRFARVHQSHRGPGGIKEVLRQRPSTEVRYNGSPARDPEVLDSAALVADAYTAFLFGSSWLATQGRELRSLGEGELDGETCQRVAGRLSPGFGAADEDHFIAWIGRDSRLLRRPQFSLNGLASTRGPDVNVVFSEHWQAPAGTGGPGRLVERTHPPLRAKAHEWTMTSLQVDGRRLK